MSDVKFLSVINWTYNKVAPEISIQVSRAPAPHFEHKFVIFVNNILVFEISGEDITLIDENREKANEIASLIMHVAAMFNIGTKELKTL